MAKMFTITLRRANFKITTSWGELKYRQCPNSAVERNKYNNGLNYYSTYIQPFTELS